MSNTGIIECLECDAEIECEYISDEYGTFLDVPEECPECGSCMDYPEEDSREDFCRGT